MVKKMMFIDWRSMKYYQIRGLLLPIFVLLIGYFSSPLLIIPTCVMLFMFFSLNPFAVEEKGSLNNLYLTLPVNRNAIVTGRYMLGFIMGASGVILGIPLMILVNNTGWSRYYLPFSWYIFILAISYFTFSLLVSITYPILFKLGYAKGKFWGFLLPALAIGLLYGTFTGLSHLPGYETLLFDILEYAANHMILINGGTAALATVFLFVSHIGSKHIYANRDF